MEILDREDALPYRGRGAPAKYPWDLWFVHMQTVRIFHGDDFTVSVTTMRQMIYQKAKHFGGKVATALGKDVRGRDCIDITYYNLMDTGIVIEENAEPIDMNDRDPRKQPLGPPVEKVFNEAE